MAQIFSNNLKVYKKQNKRSIALFYKQYGGKLFFLAKSVWKVDEDTSWELVYDSIYKIIESINKYSFKTEKELFAFSCKVLVNKIKNHLKASTNQIERVFTEKDDIAEEGSTNQENINLKTIKAELDKLKDWERMLLLLRSQGMEYKQIATYIDKPQEQLKVYYSRLKSKIEKSMKDKIRIRS